MTRYEQFLKYRHKRLERQEREAEYENPAHDPGMDCEAELKALEKDIDGIYPNELFDK